MSLATPDAHSAELDPSTAHPVIHLMPDQDGIEDIGGTLRLGSYPSVLEQGFQSLRTPTVPKPSMSVIVTAMRSTTITVPYCRSTA